MMTTTKYLGALGVLLAACGGQAVGSDIGAKADQSALKKAAAEAAAAGTATGDACATHGWYGDKVCDSFCADHDTDCVPSHEQATICAEFVEAPNGICSRKDDDPCIFQDPDCAGSRPPHACGPGVACAAISEVADGTCSRPASDPCRSQDPDCSAPVACPAIEEQPDGKCSLPASDPCRSIDPDCVTGGDGGSAGATASVGGADSNPGVVCADYVMAPDGVCSLPADDPCLFHDPDCKPSK